MTATDPSIPRGRSRVFFAVGAALAALLGGWIALYLLIFTNLPELRSLEDYHPPLTSRVLDRNGRLVGEFFEQRRWLTPLEEVPEHVVRAFVAGEDSTFFEHTGIDITSILRAAWVNLRAGGEIRQGGSTITQQMVKTLLLTPERSFRRKFREMVLAKRTEKQLTKNEILYLYLNQIYFGRGAYGIGVATRTYFGKEVKDLSVSEGALLAGLPKAPSRFSPFRNPEAADQRRRYVLSRMVEEGDLRQGEYEAALADPPAVVDPSERGDFEAAAYFTEEVRRYLFDQLGGETVLHEGLVIETSMDLDLQRAAVDALRKGLVDHDRRQGYRGPMRRVADDEVEAEVVRVGVENDLIEPPETEEEGDEEEAEVAAAEAEAPAPTPLDPQALELARPYLGVVTAVDPQAQTARVALGPGIEGVVHLEDVAWARKPDPSAASTPVKKIARIFERGDVAAFTRIEAETAEDADDEAEDAAAEAPRLVLHQEPIVQGAVLSFEVDTGDVLAMVGGYDFEKSQFNRAIQASRQPGSAFKPLIYAAALHKGYTPVSILWDRPVVYVDKESGFIWRPQNYGRAFYGPIPLRTALVRSVNNATVHLFRDLGVSFVVDYARRAGIQSDLARDLSLALGSSGVSLLELTRAYAIFPAGGRQVAPRFIKRVTNLAGEVLIENLRLGDPLPEFFAPPPLDGDESVAVAQVEFGPPAPVPTDRVISAEEAYLVTDLLRGVVADPRGTGWRLRALGRPVAGKTGTTNDQADAWFVGFSPDVVTGVWVGHDESRVLGRGETGSRAAAPIWVDYMVVALEKRPAREFKVPEGIVFARIDRETGLLADSTSTDTYFQALIEGTEPSESARRAYTSSESRRLLRQDAF